MLASIKLMREKVARLNAAADAYYNGRSEIMTDYEWDALFDEVRALERATGVVLPDSPTQRVSADATYGEKEQHEYPALSLAKTKQVKEVAAWADSRPVWVSWKLDGLTLVVTWQDGALEKVVTRGDGHVGTDITRLASAIAGIPRRIDFPGRLVVRGEAVIAYRDFEEFVQTSGEEYANPRNLASGSLSLKDASMLAPRHLRWIPFTLVKCENHIVSWGERMAALERVGLKCVEREAINKPTEAELAAAVARWTLKVAENPYPVDGLVFGYDDTDYAATGSVTGHHAVRGGLAFKWADEAVGTVLERIEWSCAVSSIPPVAVFKTVEIEGTRVSRASLCNISECERLGIGGEGTEISVIKANKIIPKVVAVTSKRGELEVPSVCPVCGAPTEIKVSESGIKTLRCTSNECAAGKLRKFIRFASKEGMDIDGLAGETIAKFVARGWLRDFADFYRLPAHAAEIAAMEGFGELSANKLVAAITAARRREAVRLVYALSIPLCGIEVAKRLLTGYSLAELFERGFAAAKGDDLFAAGDDAFAHIEGIGPVKSAAFVDWCRNPDNERVFRELCSMVELTAPNLRGTGALTGKVVVITGEVEIFANRREFKAYVEANGGKVAAAVSGATSFLVNNDIDSASTKNRKARELGVAIISEREFVERFGPKGNVEGLGIG